MNLMREPRQAPSVVLCVDRCRAKCCMTPAMGIRMKPEEMRRIKALGGKRVRIRHLPARPGSSAPWVLHFSDHGGACPFLDRATNLCGIYADRPAACVKFPSVPTSGCLLWPGEGPPRVGVEVTI